MNLSGSRGYKRKALYKADLDYANSVYNWESKESYKNLIIKNENVML
ncbi:hypothetical protein IMSAG249_02538 [Lachnospiraceae bacterium]|jgi:hypothetical protein|nr:hypothetical protein IMSAG249_02538 [Lachnospiraceae bacterium]